MSSRANKRRKRDYEIDAYDDDNRIKTEVVEEMSLKDEVEERPARGLGDESKNGAKVEIKQEHGSSSDDKLKSEATIKIKDEPGLEARSTEECDELRDKSKKCSGAKEVNRIGGTWFDGQSEFPLEGAAIDDEIDNDSTLSALFRNKALVNDAIVQACQTLLNPCPRK